jgi:hypothetical protein
MNENDMAGFPDLSGTEATRETLKAYSRVLSAVRRAHAPAHPRWWHLSLRVEPDGLRALPMAWPGRSDTTFDIVLDLRDHRVVVTAGSDVLPGPELEQGLSATALGDRLLHMLRGVGIAAIADREKYADEDARIYDPAAATAWLRAFQQAQGALHEVREYVEGERGPVQLWPHHFDLAFEWFGARAVEYVEDGEQREAKSQIGFGFSGVPSADDGEWPYCYATPWPFQEEFAANELPKPAVWITEGWEGAMLPYAAVRARGGGLLTEFCRVVYEACAPRLT